MGLQILQRQEGRERTLPFLHELHPEADSLSDILPPLLEKKYLKTIYYCHQCKGTLDRDGGGAELSVLDLDL